jgi:ketosteroid isomerase-like protein
MTMGWRAVAFTFLLLQGSCLGTNSSPEAAAIRAVLSAQIEALQAEDITAYMQTMDPASPAYDATERGLRELTGAWDLDYQLEEVRVLKIDGDSAEASFVQVTRGREARSTYPASRVSGVHTLRRGTDGVWRVFSTALTQREELKGAQPARN